MGGADYTIRIRLAGHPGAAWDRGGEDVSRA